MSMSSNPSYTVVRIKRKATDAPLSSLVINNERASKRQDLGAGRRGVFKLAETVPHTWCGEGDEGETLKSRIENLLRDGQTTTKKESTAEPSILPSESAAPAPPPVPDTQPIPLPTPPDAPRPRYRVMPRRPTRDLSIPPRVITNAEIAAAKAALVLIDAQAVGPDGQSPEPEDPEVAAFYPMLKEYLKMESGQSHPPTPKEDDEYVYDLYYRDDRAAAEGTDVGALLGYEDLSPPSTPPDSEPEDEADEDSNDEDYYRNDYPEDEDADEDMVGFEDAYSDGAWSAEEEESGGEGGVWDYRD